MGNSLRKRVEVWGVGVIAATITASTRLHTSTRLRSVAIVGGGWGEVKKRRARRLGDQRHLDRTYQTAEAAPGGASASAVLARMAGQASAEDRGQSTMRHLNAASVQAHSPLQATATPSLLRQPGARARRTTRYP